MLICFSPPSVCEEWKTPGINDVFMIDWSSNADHLPLQFGITKVARTELLKWKIYIFSIVNFHITSPKSLVSLNTLFDEMHRIHHWVKLHNFEYINSSYNLKSPLYKFALTTWQEGFFIWMISVHPAFLINVTIHKGFVAFSESCEEGSHISLYEGHSKRDEHPGNDLIERLCGHVHMEDLYTKHNKATLLISSHTNNVPFPMHIAASYHVNSKGAAYRHGVVSTIGFDTNSTSSFIPSTWTVNVSPHRMVIKSPLIRFIWYVETIVKLTKPYFWTSIYNTLQYHVADIVLRKLECPCLTLVLHVYPGLQSMFMVYGHIQPYTQYLCNITNATN